MLAAAAFVVVPRIVFSIRREAYVRARVGSRDLAVMVNAMVVQHSAGGNLARVLASMANILTERQRLDGEIKALTAEPRFSALIIQFMPVALLVLTRNSPMGVALFET